MEAKVQIFNKKVKVNQQFNCAIICGRYECAWIALVITNFCLKFLEQQTIATAPIHCKPRLWKRCVDIFEIVYEE